MVDDSAYIRALLTEILNGHPQLQVVAGAVDPYEARTLIKQHSPDVLTLDIEMPKMNGISFLKNLMRLRPMPVVMISTLTQDGAPATLQALEIGAVDFFGKPNADATGALANYEEIIIEKVLCAAKANIQAKEGMREQGQLPKLTPELINAGKNLSPLFICALGASTGGTEAIKAVVSGLPENAPPIVVAQHIPQGFSTSFAKRLDSCSKVKVYEAEDSQRIERGSVYIAPGHSHLRIDKSGGKYRCRLDKGATVNRHRPSVSVLFDSVIETAGHNAMGVLLTGMGADGADALLRMKEASCYTIAQDEATSVVWGMPGAAVKLGAAKSVLPLNNVSGAILQHAYGSKSS